MDGQKEKLVANSLKMNIYFPIKNIVWLLTYKVFQGRARLPRSPPLAMLGTTSYQVWGSSLKIFIFLLKILFGY